MTATNQARAQKNNNSDNLDNAVPANSAGYRTTLNGKGSQQNTGMPAVRPQNLVARTQAAGRDIVMMEFLHSSAEMTRTFIESQERVMLAFLNGSAGMSSQGMSVQDTMRSMPQYVPQNLQTTVKQIDLRPVIEQLNVNSQAPISNYQIIEAHETVISKSEAVSETVNNSSFNHGNNGHGNNASSEHVHAAEAKVPVTNSVQTVSCESEMSSEQLISALIDIVSQRTGYPAEMLDPTLDLEADLGIDSIKRVEILNSFRRLLPEAKQNALEDGIEKLAGVKSLQGIMDWIMNDLAALGESSSKPSDNGNDSQLALASRSA